ncbi:MAG: hypothetical protein M3P43_17265, partial [Actinomycetota bacterium]|nr:hypothetical protein [Actinomycetota bacterium]
MLAEDPDGVPLRYPKLARKLSSRPRHLQPDQSRVRGLESAPVEVERTEVSEFSKSARQSYVMVISSIPEVGPRPLPVRT